MLGIYQLIFPVYGICFTIFASGIQTAISKLVAEKHSSACRENDVCYLKSGLLLSSLCSIVLAVLLFLFNTVVAKYFLKEASCAPSLRLLCVAFPFCGITSCVHGYCYGRKKAFIPATSQLFEQSFRVLFLFLISLSIPVTCELAVVALVFGELAACCYCCIGLFIILRRRKKTPRACEPLSRSIRHLLTFSTSLTTNRLLINLLHSFETFLIPFSLRQYGHSHDEALSMFGILSGMSMSFLMFPGTLTNSLSVLLLPVVSEQNVANNRKDLSRAIATTVKYSVLLGIFSGFCFFFFGEALGIVVFGEKKAGTYLACLSFLCPFLYVSTTFSSILNGLGKINLTFLSSLLGLTLRVSLYAIWIPRFSVYGYFAGFFVSQLFITLFELFAIHHQIPFRFDILRTVLLPGMLLALLSPICLHIYNFFSQTAALSPLILLSLCLMGFAFLAFTLFVITGSCLEIPHRIK